jgi:hypothetical protein
MFVPEALVSFFFLFVSPTHLLAVNTCFRDMCGAGVLCEGFQQVSKWDNGCFFSFFSEDDTIGKINLKR